MPKDTGFMTRWNQWLTLLAPWLTGIVLLGAWIGIVSSWKRLDHLKEVHRFSEDCRNIEVRITSGLDRIFFLMQGSGAFWLQETVSHKEFQDYCRYRNIEENFPGLRALAFVSAVPPDRREAFIQDVRAEAFPDYTIHPEGARPFYAPVAYIEPLNALNRRFLGFDLFTEPTTRAAMEKARDGGLLTVSPKVTLKTDEQSVWGAGFLVIFPLYLGGFDPGTEAMRRSLVRGWLVAGFRMQDFMFWFQEDPLQKQIALSIYDGEESQGLLLYPLRTRASMPAVEEGFSLVRILSLPGGGRWILRLERLMPATFWMDRSISYGMYGAGILIAVLGGYILHSRLRRYAMATEMAHEMSASFRESEEKYRILTNGLPIGVALIGTDMRVLALNERLKRWFPDADTKDRPFCYRSFYIPPRTEPCLECVVCETMADEAPHVMERASMTAEGERWFKHTTIPFRGSDGTVQWIHEMFEDITETRIAENRLAQERKRLYAVLDTLPFFVALIQSDYTLPYVNREFVTRFGDPGQKRCYEALFGGQNPCEGCISFKVFQTRAPVVWEWSGPDGRVYSIVDSPFVDTDGTFKVLELGMDISDRRQAEAALAESRAAQEANRAKSLFLSHMSHEIRTPLNAVLGFAQILERDPVLGPKQLEQVRTIVRSGNHLMKLINDVLDLSRIEAGGADLHLETFSLNALLDEIQMMFQSRVAEKGLRFLMERDANLPETLSADETKLTQILVNIIGNAVKMTETGGIAVRVKALEEPEAPESIGKMEPGRRLRLVFEVEDSGPGMSQAEVGKIFERFSQGEAGIKVGGTGLGLAISRRYVELMGGNIEVFSQPGKGSRFRFDVRVRAVAAQARDIASAPQPIIGMTQEGPPLRILVVDDVRTNRDLVCDLLRPIGFDILEAENGKEAVEIFERHHPDAILMDMRMPVMDGYDATRRIRSLEGGKAVPIVALTASAFEEDREAVESLGVSDYLRKPFRLSELLDLLQRHLSLRYSYEQGPETDRAANQETEADFSELPTGLIETMLAATDDGDMAKLREAIDRVREIDARKARLLEGPAGRYDYEAIRNILQKRESKDG